MNDKNKKRGTLSALMTEEDKAKAGIQDLSYDYSCRIIRLYQYLTQESEFKEFVISKQLYRSGTSIGANVREAQHGQSDADFLTKMCIAHKEADESSYWLHLLHDNGYVNDTSFSSLNNDNERILRLLNAIVRTTKTRIENAKGKK